MPAGITLGTAIAAAVLALALASAAPCQVQSAKPKSERNPAVTREILAEIASAASSITDDLECASILTKVATQQGWLGDVAGADSTASVVRAREEHARKSGNPPIEEFYPSALAATAVARARAGDYKGAWKTVAEIRDRRAAYMASGESVLARAIAGDCAGALKDAAAILQAQRLAAVVAIGVAKMRSGDEAGGLSLIETSEAFKAHAEGWRTHAYRRGFGLDSRVLAYFVKRAAGYPDVPNGYEAIDAMTVGFLDGLHEAYHFPWIAAVKAQCGDPSLTKALLASLSDSESQRMAPTYVMGLLLGDDLEDAQKIAAATKPRDEKATALSFVALAQAHKGDFAASLATVQSVENKPIRAATLAVVARLQAVREPAAAAGTLATALDAVKAARDPYHVILARCNIAIAQAILSDRSGARASLEEAERLAGKGVEGFAPDFFARAFIRTRAGIGDLDAAIAKATPDKRKDAPLGWDVYLVEFARKQASSGDRHGALQTLARGMEYERRTYPGFGSFLPSTMSNLTMEMARLDRDRALQAARAMRGPEMRAYALLGVVNADLFPRLLDHEHDPRWVFDPYEP